MARAVWQTWRYSRGWRPDDLRADTLTDAGLRVVHGVEGISGLHAMTALAFEQGDTLYRDADGTLWELSGDSIRRSAPTLTELTPEAARGKFGADL